MLNGIHAGLNRHTFGGRKLRTLLGRSATLL